MAMQNGKREQEKADELDQLIDAMQRRQSVRSEDESARMAQRMVHMADQTRPSPAFTRALRAQLLTKAQQTQKNEQSTVSKIEAWIRSMTMKRTLYSLAGAAALVVIIVVAWGVGMFQRAEPVAQITPDDGAGQVVAALPTQVEPTVDVAPGTDVVVAEPLDANSSGPVVGEPDAVTEVVVGDIGQSETQAAIPVGVPSRGLGGGGGGGGGYGFGEGGSPFADATLTLNTTLPAETSGTVYQMPNPNQPRIDLEALELFATKMGVEGDLYYEWYQGMPTDGSFDQLGGYPAYRIFDGNVRILAFSGGEMIYENTELLNENNRPPLPFEQRAPIAEQFARDHGLLEFEYEMRQSWGHEVQFLGKVDGRPVHNWPMLNINVTPRGQVSNVYYRPIASIEASENVALRQASEAFDYLQAHMDDGSLFFNIISNDPNFYAPPPVADGQKTNWQREFQAGQEVTLYAWLQVFRPADGSQTPLIVTDRNMRLVADAATLEEIALATTQGNIRLTGLVSGEPGSLRLEVRSWESFPGPTDLYMTGILRMDSGRTQLELPGGFRIEIANPPADLPADETVNVSSWGVRTMDDGCGAILDWTSIDLMYQMDPYAGAPPSDPYSGISEISIDRVALVYQYLYPGEYLPSTREAYRRGENAHLAPVWRFEGVTNNGDTVEFMIPAGIDAELFEE